MPEGEVVRLYQAGESPAAIARRFGTHANAVRRLLLRLGVPLRTRGEAQRLALERGRRAHPTAGAERPPEVRARIGDGVAAHWAGLSAEDREARRAAARARWAAMGDAARAALLEAAWLGLRRAARGSKPELFLRDGLRAAGHRVEHRTPRADLEVLTGGRYVLVFVDGAHLEAPVWGADRLRQDQDAAVARRRALLAGGYAVVVVRYVPRHASGARLRRALTRLLELLESDLSNSQFHELEVD